MEIGHKASNAALYTDFSALSRLRADASKPASAEESKETTKKVASQIEALFFQMVLKSMREAHAVGESSESDQTRFYQDMFDKQITLELSKNGRGNGTGLASIIEKQISGQVPGASDNENMTATESLDLIKNQINQSANLSNAEVRRDQE